LKQNPIFSLSEEDVFSFSRERDHFRSPLDFREREKTLRIVNSKEERDEEKKKKSNIKISLLK
jgi:hypothetical protein